MSVHDLPSSGSIALDIVLLVCGVAIVVGGVLAILTGLNAFYREGDDE